VARPSSYQFAGCPNTDDVALLFLYNQGHSRPYLRFAHSASELPGIGATVGAVGFGAYDDNTILAKRSASGTVQGETASTLTVGRGSGIATHVDSGGPLLYNGEVVATVMCHTDLPGDPHVREVYLRSDGVASWVDGQVAAWESQCQSQCDTEDQQCISDAGDPHDCLCLASYYGCLRGCGQHKPVISCFPF
jgi:hypothetical protein